MIYSNRYMISKNQWTTVEMSEERGWRGVGVVCAIGGYIPGSRVDKGDGEIWDKY